MAESRSSILTRLREKIARGEPIVGGGAGTGISAKCEEAGGIDLIVIYNSGRYRMAGRGSLAGYKIPRQLVTCDKIKRSPAGKADYPWAKQFAQEFLGIDS